MYNEFDFFRSYLSSDEYVLWQGKPQKGHIFTAQDVFVIPFSIFWLGFAVVWTALASKSSAIFGLFGLPFVLVGLYMLFGRFVHKNRLKKKTAYVITNKRVIRKIGNRVDMRNLNDLPEMQVTTYKDGSGTINFGYNVTHYRGRYHRSSTVEEYEFSLENIPNVLNVQRIITDMQSTEE